MKGDFLLKKTLAWIDDVLTLTVIGENIASLLEKSHSTTVYWEAQDQHFPTEIEKIINHFTVQLKLNEALPMGEILVLHCDDRKIAVYPGAIVRTAWFEEHYTDANARLGATYEQSATSFAVWAPTATSVELGLNNEDFKMLRSPKGVWQLTMNGDWHGFTYDYKVHINGKTIHVNDPYAKALLANSEKSVVIDLARTNPPHFEAQKRPQVKNLQDAIIYELHVRDATSHRNSGVVNKGKFTGLTEIATTNSDGLSTALSYIKELGCTHVQLLPINVFARVDELKPQNHYNWGYDPLYFQVPEGSYASCPKEITRRIKECKQMIQAFHQQDLSVILDVVYNHVFIREESPFEKLVPGYYFRYHPDGTISNGTGVGNDLATEREMVRKFIVDSLDFWLREYKVDGFRFDLMGAMDLETMKSIKTRCDQEKIPIMLLGEGWSLPTALAPEQMATSFNAAHLPGFRFFNDFFRDSLKGNLFQADDKGYINGNGHFLERMPQLVSGSALKELGNLFVSEATQTVNYVECHDNHTLWDRLLLTNDQDSDCVRKKMHQLASGITLLSQGVPFLHAGQEWFRSKNGDENSYISGDAINQLDWDQRTIEDDNIAYIKNLIALRKEHDVFRLTSKQEIRNRVHILDAPEPVFGFVLLGSNEDFSIYVNPTGNCYALSLPSSGIWQIAAINDYQKLAKQQVVIGEQLEIAPYELIVLKKSIR